MTFQGEDAKTLSVQRHPQWIIKTHSGIQKSDKQAKHAAYDTIIRQEACIGCKIIHSRNFVLKST